MDLVIFDDLSAFFILSLIMQERKRIVEILTDCGYPGNLKTLGDTIWVVCYLGKKTISLVISNRFDGNY